MGKNNHLSRDQKRKIKLKKRDERSRKFESLAYHGQKYRTSQFVPLLKETETGIYEASPLEVYDMVNNARVRFDGGIWVDWRR